MSSTETAVSPPQMEPTASPHTSKRIPASLGQQRLWFLDQMREDRHVYNVPYRIAMRGNLDTDKLLTALQALVRRHDALRAHLLQEGGTLHQVVANEVPVELPFVDLAAHSPADRASQLQQLTDELARQPLDLAHGPLLRAKLVRLAADEYQLLLTLHLAIADDWSLGILFRDLAHLYVADGEPSPLPLTYEDFSRRQQQNEQGEALAAQMKYWKQRLAGTLPPLQLPCSRSRAKGSNFRGALYELEIPNTLVAGLHKLASEHNTTLNTALFTAFNVLLHRYSGQDDLLVGAPIPNRGIDVQNLMGFLVNILVMRTDVSGNPTFVDLLDRVRQQTLESLQHPDVPLDQLVQELRPQRETGQQPLFQIMFSYLEGARQSATVDGGTWVGQLLPNGTAKFDLSLMVEPEGDHAKLQAGPLWCGFEYNTDLFDAAAIERLAGHFRMLLEGIVADPKQTITQLPLLTEAERRQQLVDWNRTQADFTRDKCAFQLVEEQAARTPDRVAVAFEDRRLTYRELNSRANQLAQHLRTLGVGPDVLVGVYLERSEQMVVALLGIHKAGGAYVPLDPAFPKDRLAFYAEDSKMPVLITQASLESQMPQHQAKVVFLDSDWETIAKHSTDNLNPISKPEHLAYVIYTSGSTGKPKGVQVVQLAVTNLLNSLRKEPGLHQDDVLLAVTTLSFDIHVLENWLPLIVGAHLVVVSRDVAGDGIRLLETLNKCKATLLQATPATFRLLVAAGWKSSPQMKVICGGEPMTVELAQQLLERVGSVWNLYGPTETTVWSTAHQILSANPPILIGHPIDNTTVYILDKFLNPVPMGAPGEIHIGGDGLARGYLNRPELTAEKFIPDPFGAQPGARMYKAGDLGRYLPDGTIECLGRIDHQVKVRGYRIELGEIETVLGKNPAVRTNVVVARKDDSGADHLVAYLIAKDGQDVSAEPLRRYLKEQLPDYMVPSYFVTLASFPLTPNGKIDRKALPAPDQSSAAAQRTVVPPTNDAERDLIAIWEEVLKVKPIGIRDNFFDLGGHSFLAAVLMSKIKQKLGHTLPLGTIFSAPTVEKLALLIQQSLEGGTDSSIVSLHEEGQRPPLFMIAGVGGHVFTFHKFARLLGDDQPAYGVKAIGVDGVSQPLDRIEDIAAQYLKEVIAIRPTGPIILSGYSVGALVAYELAVQLRAAGRDVPMLVVFDMNAPGYPRRLPFVQRMGMHMKTFLRLPMDEKKDYLQARFRNVRGRVMKKLGLLTLEAPEIAGAEALPQDALKKVWAGLMVAMSRYMPTRKFDGKVVLFRAEEGFDWAANVFDDPLMGWGQWTSSNVEAHTIPGGHLAMFNEQNIGGLAETLKGSVKGLPLVAR